MTRHVTKTRKDPQGDITHLCGSNWSDTKKQAKLKIDKDRNAYKSGSSLIEVVPNPRVTDGFYLRTVADGSTGNNLNELPNC